MPKNMTVAEIRNAEREFEKHLPGPIRAGDGVPALDAISFTIGLSPDRIVLRCASTDGETRDVRLSQSVALALAHSLNKLLFTADWMDSKGHIVPSPEPPER